MYVQSWIRTLLTTKSSNCRFQRYFRSVDVPRFHPTFSFDFKGLSGTLRYLRAFSGHEETWYHSTGRCSDLALREAKSETDSSGLHFDTLDDLKILWNVVYIINMHTTWLFHSITVLTNDLAWEGATSRFWVQDQTKIPTSNIQTTGTTRFNYHIKWIYSTNRSCLTYFYQWN